jgi:hypothetical protein
MSDKPVKAISLLSGGLDSLLATRVVSDQGVDVTALQFISPFFGASTRGKEAELEEFYRDVYKINARVIDVSHEYLHVLGNPKYGYGKNFNPCIDCKIFLFTRALEIMKEEGAEFLITGEVIGQRPMSQRRDAMNIIAKNMGAKERLLRPLSAKIMPETLPEQEGWVDREKLFDFSGRSRKPQMALAIELGMDGYPSPAGGCALTDPILAKRVQRYFEETPEDKRNDSDIRFILKGRTFRFPGGSYLTMGRNEGENKAVYAMKAEGDEVVKVIGPPGPLGLFRSAEGVDERELAASVLVRYCPKAEPDQEVGFGADEDTFTCKVKANRPDDELLESWRR